MRFQFPFNANDENSLLQILSIIADDEPRAFLSRPVRVVVVVVAIAAAAPFPLLDIRLRDVEKRRGNAPRASNVMKFLRRVETRQRHLTRARLYEVLKFPRRGRILLNFPTAKFARSLPPSLFVPEFFRFRRYPICALAIPVARVSIRVAQPFIRSFARSPLLSPPPLSLQIIKSNK